MSPTTVVFRRLQSRLELDGGLPSGMFAYRRQQPPQQAGLLSRLLVAYWASVEGDVSVADWDESNAFCNIPRSDAGLLVEATNPHLGDWLQRFYAPFSVFVVTPHGLTQPYKMKHGGGQGDSGGVGAYLAVSIQRTTFHYTVLSSGLHPRDLRPGALSMAEACFASPTSAVDYIPEICFSDDRRLFGRGDVGVARVLDVVCHGCWKSGASVNGGKIHVFKLRIVEGKMRYQSGTLYSTLGPLQYKRGGLALVGIPLVMGAPPSKALLSTVQRLNTIHAGVCRLRPSYVLALRITSAYALAKLDYVYEVIPPDLPRLHLVQRASDSSLAVASCLI